MSRETLSDVIHQALRPNNRISVRMLWESGIQTALRWLEWECAGWMALTALRRGKNGIAKHIFLGTGDSDNAVDYLAAFVAFARESDWGDAKFRS